MAQGETGHMRILFISPRFPLPAIKGDKLRAWQFLQHLSAAHEVTLVSCIETDDEKRLLRRAGNLCRVETATFDLVRRAFLASPALLRKEPFQAALFRTRGLRRLVREYAPQADVIHCNTLRAAGLVPRDWTKPLVVDFIDSLSGSFRQRARLGGRVRGAFMRREAARLEAYERALARRATLALAVSDAEAARLGENVKTVPHAVDTELFMPPPSAKGRDGIVMTGNFAYGPNVEGAQWFVREVLPRVLEKAPETWLRIVGANPDRKVRKLESNVVEVTGEVASVAAELRDAAVAVAPMKTCTGVQTKVLEAMACATPVVATSAANAGIDAPPEVMSIADDAPAFAGAVAALLSDVKEAKLMGGNARAFVEERYSTAVSGARLLELYAGLEGGHG